MGEKKEKKEKKEDKVVRKGSTTSLTSEKSFADLDHRKLFKDGQKFLTPPVADATRAFYESLLAEHPESKIAIRFCVEYGVCGMEEHKKLLKRYNALKDKGAFSVSMQIKKALEKQASKGKLGKDKKDKKDGKEGGKENKDNGKDKK